MTIIQVLILHRSRLSREALTTALEKSGPFQATSATPSANTQNQNEIIDRVSNLSSDVILLDLDFPFKTGLSDARCILEHCPSARVILTGVPFVESEILTCIGTGVAGCGLEDASLPELAEIIKGVYAGENRCSPQITKLLFMAVSGRAQTLQPGLMRGDIHLTNREKEVTELIDRGLCNKEIAIYLGIELQTVKNHVHNVLDKLHLRKRHDAARYARNLGLLTDIIGIRDVESKRTST